MRKSEVGIVGTGHTGGVDEVCEVRLGRVGDWMGGGAGRWALFSWRA